MPLISSFLTLGMVSIFLIVGPLLIQPFSVICELRGASAGYDRDRREGEMCQRKKDKAVTRLGKRGEDPEKSGSSSNGDCH